MQDEPMTVKEMKRMILSARDSVTAIEDVIEELNYGMKPMYTRKDTIKRNVQHLKHVVGQLDIEESDLDVSDLEAGIALGEAKLAEVEWLGPYDFDVAE